LPIRYIPEGTEVGQDLRVFIYTDSEDRIIATTLDPMATEGDIAFLEVNQVGEYGAFLKWGLPKDLFVPFREQHRDMEEGKSYLVKIILDEKSDRLIGSSRLDRHLKSVVDEADNLEEGGVVELMLAAKTDVGYKAVVNGKYWGLLYTNEVFSKLDQGQVTKGYIKKIREDGKIDLSLQPQGYQQQIPLAAQQVLQKIKDHDGLLLLTDKSKPEEIYKVLKMSKKAFKKAVGLLYKQRMITLEKQGLRINAED
jgi:predicted RNA-binding protein (virulence factor B family)